MLQFALIMLLLAASDGCAHRSPQPQPGDSRGLYGNSIVIKGSDTMVLLAQWWAENYLKSHPHLIIQVNGCGSGTGIAALLNETTDICQSSRPIKDITPQARSVAARGASLLRLALYGPRH
jgi:phosphate transport system substrate-binding protein